MSEKTSLDMRVAQVISSIEAIASTSFKYDDMKGAQTSFRAEKLLEKMEKQVAYAEEKIDDFEKKKKERKRP